MGTYLKAAFYHRVTVPGLGAMPLNFMAVVAFLILGAAEWLRFGHFGFWLLGLGLETAYLVFLSTHPVFQSVVDAMAGEQDLAQELQQAEQRRQQLIERLTPDGQKKFHALAKQAAKVTQLERASGTKEYLIKANWEALQKLLWMYLKLLTAWQNLQDSEHEEKEAQVKKQLAKLDHTLEDQALSATLRDSHLATREILQKRLQGFAQREEFLAKLDNDMARIEAQMELAVENAAMNGHGQVLSDEIDTVSSFLREMQQDFYGDSRDAIADLDKLYR